MPTASDPVPESTRNLHRAHNATLHNTNQAMGTEMARAERVAAALEPTPTPDHLRYGGMTATPLIRQLFGNIGGKAASRNKAGNEGRNGKSGTVVGCGRGGDGGSGKGGSEGENRASGAKICNTERLKYARLAGHDGAAPSPWGNLAGEVQDGQQKNKEGTVSLPGTRSAEHQINNSVPSTFVPKSGGDGRSVGGRNNGGDRKNDKKHEDRFASALEHHKRNVIAAAKDP